HRDGNRRTGIDSCAGAEHDCAGGDGGDLHADAMPFGAVAYRLSHAEHSTGSCLGRGGTVQLFEAMVASGRRPGGRSGDPMAMLLCVAGDLVEENCFGSGWRSDSPISQLQSEPLAN